MIIIPPPPPGWFGHWLRQEPLLTEAAGEEGHPAKYAITVCSPALVCSTVCSGQANILVCQI